MRVPVKVFLDTSSIVLRFQILRALELYPGGHNLQCLSNRKNDRYNSQHICTIVAKPDPIVEAELKSLIRERKIEKVGAYYFLRGAS